MDANHFKNELLILEEKLKESAGMKGQQPAHSARHLYFELQRLIHSYESTLLKAESNNLV